MGEPFYLRNSDATLMTHQGKMFFATREGQAVRSIVPAQQLTSAHSLVAALGEPRSVDQICAVTGLPAAAVDGMLEQLVREGILLSGDHGALMEKLSGPPNQQGWMPPCKRLVIGITGSIFANQMFPFVSGLKRSFAGEIDVILTAAARKFVVPQVFEYLGIRVWTRPWETKPGIRVPHMHLATRSDLVLILPATASCIHRLATGACSDLISLVVTATSAPVVIAPAMNSRMASFFAVNKNIELLRAAGMYIIEPGFGVETSREDLQYSFAGVGINPAMLCRFLSAVLQSHRKAAARSFSCEGFAAPRAELAAPQ